MLVDTVVVSALVGKLRGGSLSSLGEVPLKRIEIIVAAFAVEALVVALGLRGIELVSVISPYAFLYAYASLLYAVWVNRDIRWMSLIGLGILLNFSVILANSMRMPVSADALVAAGMSQQVAAIEAGRVLTYKLMDSTTRLRLLGDIIPICSPYPVHRVVSLGDLVMALGVFLLIQREMLMKRARVGLGRKATTPTRP